MLDFFKKLPRYYLILPASLAVLVWSLLGFTWPELNLLGFLIISLLALILAINDLRLAIALLLLELIIGSKGYLFSLDFDGWQISIRMALWLIIMSAWLAKFSLDQLIRQKLRQQLTEVSTYYFFGLLAACLVSVLIGLANNNPSNIFFDANSWLFLSLALPLATSFSTAKDLQILFRVFVLGVSALALATLCLAYVFSHNLGTWPLWIYSWLRSTGLAEITWTPHGFWRIFLQSHLYLVPAWFALQLASLQKTKTIKAVLALNLAGGLIISALFFSLSRSLILGSVLTSLVILLVVILNKDKVGRLLSFSFISLAIASLVIWLMVASGSASWAALLDRANITNEAAASSRWNLLPIIWQDITANPVFGQGFGKTITYRSADPRILAQDPNGFYSTYAFEWGWLDLWLKLGLWGVLIYLFWLGYLSLALFKLRQTAASWIAYSLIALAIIHFFTPYLNHPLGLMIVLISAQALKIWQQDHQKTDVSKIF